MKRELARVLLDLEDVEQADEQQDHCVDQRDKEKRKATNVPHLSIEFEVALSAKNPVSPLNNSAKKVES